MSEQEKKESENGDEIDEEYIKAGVIILNLLESQKRDVIKTMHDTKEEREDSIEKTKAMLEKHIGEKAFLASRQKETMAKAAKLISEGELGDVIKKLDKEIGIKAFLAASAKERDEYLKKIQIPPEHFRGIQEKIGDTVAAHAIASDRIRASSQQMLSTKDDRVQRMKDATSTLEKSSAIASRAMVAEKQKQQSAQLGDKQDRVQRMKDAAESLEQDPAFLKKQKKEDED
nr:hypothetical protein [Candidatus Sigynarchaeota archaeon]